MQQVYPVMPLAPMIYWSIRAENLL